MKSPASQKTWTKLFFFFIDFQLLEDDIVSFVRNEIKKIKKILSPDYPECLESKGEDETILESEDEEEQKRSNRDAVVKIILHFLRKMKQGELVDRLQSSKRICLEI